MRLFTKSQPPLISSKIFYDLGAEARRDVLARQRVGHVGGEKADLGAAVEAAAFELEAVEGLRPRQLDHGVGQLDLATGTALLRAEEVENFRLQDVAACEDQIRGARSRGGFSTMLVMANILPMRSPTPTTPS